MKFFVILQICLMFFTICATVFVTTKMDNPSIGEYIGIYSVSAIFFVLTLIEANRLSLKRK